MLCRAFAGTIDGRSGSAGTRFGWSGWRGSGAQTDGGRVEGAVAATLRSTEIIGVIDLCSINLSPEKFLEESAHARLLLHSQMGTRQSPVTPQVRHHQSVCVEHVQLLEAFRLQHLKCTRITNVLKDPFPISNLVLPGDRHRSGVELVVECVVRGVQAHALHRAELFDVQHVLGVHRMRVGAEGGSQLNRQIIWFGPK